MTRIFGAAADHACLSTADDSAGTRRRDLCRSSAPEETPATADFWRLARNRILLHPPGSGRTSYPACDTQFCGKTRGNSSPNALREDIFRAAAPLTLRFYPAVQTYPDRRRPESRRHPLPAIAAIRLR